MCKFSTLFFVFINLMIITNNASASWAIISDEDLIVQSDLIATGTLVDEKTITREDGKGQFLVGVIKLHNILKGDAQKKQALVVLRHVGAPQISTQPDYKIGQNGLWYLITHWADKSLFLADDPQRFVSIEKSEVLIQSIKLKLKAK